MKTFTYQEALTIVLKHAEKFRDSRLPSSKAEEYLDTPEGADLNEVFTFVQSTNRTDMLMVTDSYGFGNDVDCVTQAFDFQWNCAHLPGVEVRPWAADEEEELQGFIYDAWHDDEPEDLQNDASKFFGDDADELMFEIGRLRSCVDEAGGSWDFNVHDRISSVRSDINVILKKHGHEEI